MRPFYCHCCSSERPEQGVTVDCVGEITCKVCNQGAVERRLVTDIGSIESATTDTDGSNRKDEAMCPDAETTTHQTPATDNHQWGRMPPELANLFSEAGHAPVLNVENLCATQLEPGVMAYNAVQPETQALPTVAASPRTAPPGISSAPRSSYRDLHVAIPEMIRSLPGLSAVAQVSSAPVSERTSIVEGSGSHEGRRHRLINNRRSMHPRAAHSLAAQQLYSLRHAPVFRRNRRPHTHVGVTCDGCESTNFLGLRYRCLICRDYDLCERCFDNVALVHPFEHTFEVLTRASFRSLPVINIIMAFEEAPLPASSGLSSEQVAWWLASPEVILEKTDDPSWACSICTDNELIDESGWLVCICRQDRDADNPSNKGSHVFHSDCIRKWLLQDNSCPICRRTPIYTE